MAPKLVSAVDRREEGGGWSSSLICFDGEYSNLRLDQGSNLAFKVLEGRFCVGYTGITVTGKGDVTDSRRNPRPCPLDAEVKRGVRCGSCQRSHAMTPCLRCDGADCRALPEMRRACLNSTAYVYLASFGGGRVKAGVSRGRRVMRRWIEQGADVAMRVLVGDGMEVRKFERRIQEELGALNHVRSVQKMDPVRRSTDIGEAVERLDKFRRGVHGTFPEESHFLEEPQVLLSLYGLPEFNKRPVGLRVKEGLQVSGNVLGVKGPILFLEMGGLPRSLSLNRLLGRRIETEGVEKVRTQSGLERFMS